MAARSALTASSDQESSRSEICYQYCRSKIRLVKIEVTGATLRAALEHGVSRSAEDSEPGGFPQVSGIQFTFDASRRPGSRIVEAKVNGLPLDDAKKYTLTTTTFTGLDGGDGYTMFKAATVIILLTEPLPTPKL